MSSTRITTTTDTRITTFSDVRVTSDAPTTPEVVEREPTISIGRLPSLAVIEAFESSAVKVSRWVDIYEKDGLTPWMTNVAVTGGSVSVDMTRSERRNIDLQLGGVMEYGPGAFWYDKVIKPFYGVHTSDDYIWATQLGQFMIDSVDRPNFPEAITCTGRDYSKKLIQTAFAQTTTFAAGLGVGEVIRAIAINGGVNDFRFEEIDSVLPELIGYDPGDSRWEACQKLAVGAGCELFFDSFGFLILRPWVDPETAVATHAFRADEYSNMIKYSKTTNDSRLFNDIIVYSDNASTATVYGRAENTNPGSPTNIAAIGRRMDSIASKSVANNAQANKIAQQRLSVAGLEPYDVSITSLVAPWLEAGDAVSFIDPAASSAEPTKFILSSFSIPFALGPMDASIRRVVRVG